MNGALKMHSRATERKRQSPSDAQARAFASKKFRWLEQVARDYRSLPALASPVCIWLCHLFNIEKSGAAWPWQDEIARAFGVKRETVNRLLAALIDRGHLKAVRQGQGQPSRYYMVVDEGNTGPPDVTETITSSDPDVTEPVTSNTARCDRFVRPDVTDSGVSCDRIGHTESSPKTPKGKKRALAPDDASLGLKKESGEESEPQAEPVAAIEDAFQRFWSVYPRKVNEDDARRAFAVIEAADIEAVITRAELYALERTAAVRDGDDPKWTLYPATWLKKKKWKDPPPEGAVIDGLTGEAIPPPPPKRRSGQPTWAEVTDELLAELEADEAMEARDGTLH